LTKVPRVPTPCCFGESFEVVDLKRGQMADTRFDRWRARELRSLTPSV